MGRSPSPQGYGVSRYNRLSNGVMLHSILPSRGISACPLSTGCPCCEDDLRHLCVPGEPCSWETIFHARYLESGREAYQRCLNWMSEQERDDILKDLALFAFRRMRLSALVAKQGPVRPKRHARSGIVYGLQSTVGVGRYAAAIDNGFNPLIEQLLYSPDERLADPEDEVLILPFRVPDR